MVYHLLLRSSFFPLSLGRAQSATLSNGLVLVVPRLQVAERGIRSFGGRGLCEIRTIFWCLTCLRLISFSAAILLLPLFLSGPPRVLLARCSGYIRVIWVFLPLDVSFHMASSALMCLSCFLYDKFRRSRSFVRVFFLL